MSGRGVVLAAGVALGVVLAAAGARPAQAQTRRVAVVIGNNTGGGSRPGLRFAELDASRVASLLGELGGVERDDLFLRTGRPVAELRAAMQAATARLQEHRRLAPKAKVLLIFYFSGHSDGRTLEIGRESLPFLEVRRWLESTGADVRLGILDTCRSGALLTLKAGVAGPPFEIRLADAEDLGTEGEVIISSSAADEAALESSEIAASFFTHHLLSGLRGAADLSGDDQVTLSEALDYAYRRTVSATAETVIGPQHPVADLRLARRGGDLVLSSLRRRPAAQLTLPSGFDRLLVLRTDRADMVAEVGPHSARTLAIPAGRYRLRAWRGSSVFAGELEAKAGERVEAPALKLLPAQSLASASKGRGDEAAALTVAGSDSVLETIVRPPSRRPVLLSLAGGATRGVASGAGYLPSLRLGAERGDRWLWGLYLDAASVRSDPAPEAPRFRETHLGLALGLKWRIVGTRRFHAAAGPELGAAIAWQSADRGATGWSPLLSPAAAASASVHVAGPVWLTLAGRLPLAFLRRDGGIRAVLLPAFWLGPAVSF